MPHTPGPWQAVKAPDDQYGPNHWSVSDCVEALEKRTLIAEINTTVRNPLRPPKDHAADARLIAAAPELLAACETGVKLCRCRGTGTYTKDCTLCGDSTFDHVCNDEERPCTDPRCMALRAAIAKAKGGFR